jgi:hypothetical protein
MYAKMLFKIFLLLSLVCVSYSSRAKIAEKVYVCEVCQTKIIYIINLAGRVHGHLFGTWIG